MRHLHGFLSPCSLREVKEVPLLSRDPSPSWQEEGEPLRRFRDIVIEHSVCLFT
jgi:hypothetical protein